MGSTPHNSSDKSAAADEEGASGVWLHRYACLVAFATLILIAAGGMVTSTGSGLSVPDWPNTYGENLFLFPPSKWVGGIFYEHGHRLIASAVGMLTIGLAVWIHRTEERRWMRRLGWIALCVVIVQGILGGMTVKFNLPTWISVLHACLAQSFFCIMLSIAVFTSRLWKNRGSRTAMEPDGRLRAVAVCLVAVVFLQLILGALMRHTHSGLAVPDFPLAYGRLIPGLSESDIADYNHQRAFNYLHIETALSEVTREQVLVHMIHRAGAVLVTLAVLAAMIVVLSHRVEGLIRRPIYLMAILVAGQIAMGAWTVLSGRTPWIATAHVAIGAMLLGVSVTFALRVFGLTRVVPIRLDAAAPNHAIRGMAA